MGPHHAGGPPLTIRPQLARQPAIQDHTTIIFEGRGVNQRAVTVERVQQAESGSARRPSRSVGSTCQLVFCRRGPAHGARRAPSGGVANPDCSGRIGPGAWRWRRPSSPGEVRVRCIMVPVAIAHGGHDRQIPTTDAQRRESAQDPQWKLGPMCLRGAVWSPRGSQRAIALPGASCHCHRVLPSYAVSASPPCEGAARV
jgi:hypothetical protein